MGGKTSTTSRNKYNAKAYDRINFVVKKGRKEEIQKAADAMGESLNKFISTAVDERMEKISPATGDRRGCWLRSFCGLTLVVRIPDCPILDTPPIWAISRTRNKNSRLSGGSVDNISKSRYSIGNEGATGRRSALTFSYKK